jgi:hypothetical protein
VARRASYTKDVGKEFIIYSDIIVGGNKPPTLTELVGYARTYIQGAVEHKLAYLPPCLRAEAEAEARALLERLKSEGEESFSAVWYQTWLQPIRSYCSDAYSRVLGGAFYDWERKYTMALREYWQRQVPGVGVLRSGQLAEPWSLRQIVDDPDDYYALMSKHSIAARDQARRTGRPSPSGPVRGPGYRTMLVPRKQLAQVYALASQWVGECEEPEDLVPNTSSFGVREIR